MVPGALGPIVATAARPVEQEARAKKGNVPILHQPMGEHSVQERQREKWPVTPSPAQVLYTLVLNGSHSGQSGGVRV